MRGPCLSVVGIVTLLTLAPLVVQAAIPDSAGTTFRPNLSNGSPPIPRGTPNQGRAYREACAQAVVRAPHPRGDSSPLGCKWG
jgi:hypothetical protein